MRTPETEEPVVYTCNCTCHMPRGWRWKVGDPETKVFVPCERCADVRHTAYDAPWEDEMTKPEPVRSIPVPLTVRRHTPESRAILLGNLMAALPTDMLDEDRERIATILLDTTIAHSDELRRRRIVDKLMDAAEKAEDANPQSLSPAWRERLAEWSDLMCDAAEEIRSVM